MLPKITCHVTEIGQRDLRGTEDSRRKIFKTLFLVEGWRSGNEIRDATTYVLPNFPEGQVTEP